MVAIPDIAQDHDGALAIEGHARSRALNWFMGGVLMAAAPGLWLVPGAAADPVLALIKLGLTVFFVLGGATFLLSARQAACPEVHLDGRHGVLRLLERDAHGRVQNAVEIGYDELSEVDFRDGMLIARDHHGQPVIEMPVEHAGDMDAVRAALGPAFRRDFVSQRA